MFEENEDFDLDENWLNDVPQSSSTSNKTLKHNTLDISPNRRLSNHTTVNTITKTENSKPKVVLKRKFPGPAGLFPEFSGTSKEYNRNSNPDDSFILSTQLLCSQSPTDIFEKATWSDMCNEFNNSTLSLIQKYNIKFVKDNLSCRIPFLAASIKKVKNTSKSPIFVLADLTGEIEALISTDLYEDYNEFLTVNSVVILKEFSILSINNLKNYINITCGNLVRIYFNKEEENEVKILHLQQITTENLMKKVEEFFNKEYVYNNHKLSENIENKSEFNGFKVKNNQLHKKNNSSDNMFCNKTLENQNNTTSNKNVNDFKKKFKFKEILQRKNLESSKNNEKSINSEDLALSLDDFDDEFVIPENSEEKSTISDKNINKQHKNVENSLLNTTNTEILNKKLKLDTFKVRNENLHTFDIPANVQNDLSNNESSNTLGKKIDCSQISIISQNNENPDIIKEIFSDLDATFFDDFQF